MIVIDTSVTRESRDRYLTYALSVVSGRAIPDVRDGLKPVQRRILYAMLANLGLRPAGSHRKCAAVVGEVLARFHPHGDIACYEALVRMAQDFSLRYPLVDGQGNFGSLDGDNAAAYRYTEAKLTPIAIEVLGEINEETVDFRDNFDATTVEPIVLPSRVPNLLVNGSTGIAVGMATSIPPHNLRDVCKAMVELSKDPEISIQKLVSLVRAPDFPTGCSVLNSSKELVETYRSGKGSVRMRGDWSIEEQGKGKRAIIISSIPYAVDKSQLVEKIANAIIERKVPQLVDVRDESTEVVRIVLELAADVEPEVAMSYLFKNTTLETTFPVNMTVLVPTEGGPARPELLSLKGCMQHFLDFREQVVERKLIFERKQLEERIHILEGLVLIFDELDEAIRIVRKSEGRGDAAEKLRVRFKLTEIQAFAVVDMRIYQLSRTNIEEIREELTLKRARVEEINRILGDKNEILGIVRAELEEIAEKFGDKRLSKIVKDAGELEFNAEDYVVQEDVFAIVTADGWVKRIRQSNELSSTRIREGDRIDHAHPLNTVDSVVFFTNLGNLYLLRVADFPASSGYGAPIQKILKFKDDERVVASFAMPQKESDDAGEFAIKDGTAIVLVSANGTGSGLTLEGLGSVKRSGKRVAKLRDGDSLAAVAIIRERLAMFTRGGLALLIDAKEIPVRDSAAVGVSLISVRDGDEVTAAVSLPKGPSKIVVHTASGKEREVKASEIQSGHRGLRGSRAISRDEVVSAEIFSDKSQAEKR